MPFCTHCGHANAESARFCSSCGAVLRQGDMTTALSVQAVPGLSGEPATEPEAESGSVSQADLAAVDALPSGSALLVVRRGPNAGSRFLLDEDSTTTGRHPESDIFLDDVTVSRRHAEFVRQEGGGFLVRDVGSLNGTYVNRERIDSVTLTGGDEVQVGKYRLVFLPSEGGGTKG